MATSRMMMLAVLSLVLQSCAVTIDTSTPTSDSNYMVLQGDWQYLDSRGVSFGILNGRVQMVRSALSAQTTFSYIIHFSDGAQAPPAGTVLTARLARRSCSSIDTVASLPTFYQDPYLCPGYSFSSDTNDANCDANYVSNNPNVEVAIDCTVQTSGSSSYCSSSFSWPLYIPEEQADQRVDDMSLVIFSPNGGSQSEFACGNFDPDRELVPATVTEQADGSGNVPNLVSGFLEKDELGYTHLDLTVDSLSAGESYFTYVSASPCSSNEATYASHVQISALSSTDVADSSGTLAVETHTSSVLDAWTMSIVVVSDSSMIACYDLETFFFPGTGRQGQVGSSSNGCAAWEQFYSSDETDGSSVKGKKGKKHRIGKNSFDKFQSYSINSQARCCLANPYVVEERQDGSRTVGKGKGKGKGKASSLLSSFSSQKGTASRTGLWAGVTGIIVLAAGVAMHIRRRRQTSAAPDSSALTDETTPLTMTVSNSPLKDTI